MKTKYIVLAIATIGLVAILYYSSNTDTSDAAWQAELQREREEKDLFMKNNEDSPFKQDTTQTFRGLSYYAPDIHYRVMANLEPADKQVITLTTSDQQVQQYIRYAWATFDLSDFHCKLLILQPLSSGAQRDMLFLPFADATSAMETYGAGRYLELKKVPGATTITLDFNKAYNPYCAYVDHFSCPLPPRENILKVPVQAGEKNYHE